MSKIEEMEKLYRALASEADVSDASLDTITEYVININRIKRKLWETWYK